MEYRKFNLNTAITGDKYLNLNNTCVWLGRSVSNDFAPNIIEILYADGKSRRLCYAPDDELFQIPICIIEDKPVYSNDILYHCGVPCHMVSDDGYNYIIQYRSNNLKTQADIRDLSWNKPKVKKSGWINIYPHRSSHIYIKDVLVLFIQLKKKQQKLR